MNKAAMIRGGGWYNPSPLQRAELRARNAQIFSENLLRRIKSDERSATRMWHDLVRRAGR
jgi:hypothetical protein